MAMIDGHIDELRRRNLAPSTMRRRRKCALDLAAWLHPRPLVEARTIDIEVFLDAMDIGPQTRYTWCSHLHCVFDHGLRAGIIDKDPTTLVMRPKIPRRLPRPIATDDLRHALSQANPLMRAWLMLAAFAGMRCHEIAHLEGGDVVESRMLLHVTHGKGQKERVVPLHVDLLAALKRHGLPRKGRLFERPTGEPYSAQNVSKDGSRFLRRCGVDATMHQLRHWFATTTYDECRDILTVQRLLGHSSPATTAIYTALSPGDARRAVAGLDLSA